MWGTLVNSATGNLEINAQTINNYPIADFDFAGNGSGTENPAAFLIDTGSIPLPAGSAAGDPAGNTAADDAKAVAVESILLRLPGNH